MSTGMLVREEIPEISDAGIEAVASEANTKALRSAQLFGYKSDESDKEVRKLARSTSRTARALQRARIKPFTEESVAAYKAKMIGRNGLATRAYWITGGITGAILNFHVSCYFWFDLCGKTALGWPITFSLIFALVGLIGITTMEREGHAFEKERASMIDIGWAGFFLGIISIPISAAYLWWMFSPLKKWTTYALADCKSNNLNIPQQALFCIDNLTDRMVEVLKEEKVLEDDASERERARVLQDCFLFRVERLNKRGISREWGFDFDPFLIVCDQKTGNEYYVAVWDEPGFKAEVS